MKKRYVYAGSRHIAKIAGADTHYYHCDALGSPRTMASDAGGSVWYARYYPFGEMTSAGTSSNSHGFTGKEWDSEIGLNYFCQRYYDPEIGRFMNLDTWTNLPDDERLLSYQKYMSWDNHTLEYNPQGTYDINDYYIRYKNQNLVYDTLVSALIPIKPRLPIPSNDLQIKAYPGNLMNYGKRIPRYIARNHQLNGYLYCRNNPLKYIDPTGNRIDERDLVGYFGGVLGSIGWGYIGGSIGGALGPFGAIAGGIIGGISGGFIGMYYALDIYDRYYHLKDWW